MVYDTYEKMIDEQLIDEVEQHGVIYNRQKYCINMGAGSANGNSSGGGVNKYETKDEAWQEIAMNLRSDVETCKKRWKYLRERYVSQRKQGDPPVYEHLSRPYLEKMKFLDQHIQPRKSYRNVSSFLTSPNASNSFCEYNMDSSKSNSSMKNHSFNAQQHHQQQLQHQQQQQSQSLSYPQENIIKTEEDPTFRDFVAAVASQSQHLQQINAHHASSFNPSMMASPSDNGGNHHISNIIPPPIQQQSVDNYDQFRASEQGASASGAANVGNGVASSTSSSMKSPLSSSPPPPPPVTANNNASSELSDEQNFATNSSGNSMKKARVQVSNQYLDTSDSDDSPLSSMRHAKMLNDSKHAVQHLHQSHQHHQQQQQQQILQQQQKHQQQYNKMFNNPSRNMNSLNHTPAAASGGLYPSSNDFLFSLYQQMSPAAAAAVVQQERNINAAAAVASTSSARSSEHLLGELVTSELLKMNKDRRKTVQKRILEILFFED
ncbi:ras-interacting protein RIP3 [Eupeodes corollae]|uniref:ras-interacting protein RIP3 n=1 Tax=Eupeodes corollae TaxID=290404 RepID=UPI00249292BE|nr:ras-interacting protein RIP3 [Eupeodes corollae]